MGLFGVGFPQITALAKYFVPVAWARPSVRTTCCIQVIVLLSKQYLCCQLESDKIMPISSLHDVHTLDSELIYQASLS